MTFIQINLDKMLSVINNLDERAAIVDDERRKIDDESSHNHDPVEFVVEATEVSPVLSSPTTLSLAWCANLHTCAEGLRSLADELRVRRQEAIDLNSNGITTNPSGGVATYYLPDPPPDVTDVDAYWARTDTVANVQAYNSQSVATAKSEAAELEEALANGRSSRGRTPEEIIEQINKHRDIPTYGLAFCMTMGVDTMLDAPLNAQADTNYAHEEQPAIIPTMIDTFGHLMCAASSLSEPSSYPVASSPDSAHQYSLAGSIYEAVTEEGHEGRATALDAYMTADGTVYDTDFLVGLGGYMEGIEEWPDEPRGVTWTTNSRNDDYGARYLPGHSTDPLAAVLNAMGNNPEAANAYLAPPDEDYSPLIDNEGGDDYWRPSDLAQQRMEMLASREWTPQSLEGLSSAFAAVSANRAPAPGNDTDHRAAWATGQGILMLAKQNLPNGTVDENIGIMLGNFGPEVVGIANRSGIVPDDYEVYQTSSVATGADGESIEAALAHLLWEASDSAQANHYIVRGTTVYTAARASAAVQADTSGNPLAAIKVTYDDQASVLDLISALSQDRADDGYNGAMAAAGLLSAVPGAGLLGTGVSTALTLQGSPQVDATGHAESSALRGAAYTNAFESGLINNPPDPATTSWYSVGPDGRVTISLDTEDQLEDFNGWILAGAGGSPTVKSTFNEIGVDDPAARWESADDFKKQYGGASW